MGVPGRVYPVKKNAKLEQLVKYGGSQFFLLLLLRSSRFFLQIGSIKLLTILWGKIPQRTAELLHLGTSL